MKIFWKTFSVLESLRRRDSAWAVHEASGESKSFSAATWRSATATLKDGDDCGDSCLKNSRERKKSSAAREIRLGMMCCFHLRRLCNAELSFPAFFAKRKIKCSRSLRWCFFTFPTVPVCLPIMRSIPIRSIICRRLTFYSCGVFELFLPLFLLSFIFPLVVGPNPSSYACEKKTKKFSRPLCEH